MSSKVADIVTEKIIAALETGVAPWRKTWKTPVGRFARNLVSRRPYNGVNQLLLQLSGYPSPYWLTYKQAAELGGQVRSGEKGTPVIYVGRAESKKDKKADGTAKDFTFLRYYTVFNVAQIDGLDAKVPQDVVPADHKPIEAAEAIWAGYKDRPVLRPAKAPHYQPELDYIGMPDMGLFESASAYYATLFHEAIHSTGHESRLNRDGVATTKEHAAFGTETYGKEELVAELGAAFLCNHVGIENIPASAAYCKSWIKTIKGDTSLIITAAAAAQKAFRYIVPEPTEADPEGGVEQ